MSERVGGGDDRAWRGRRPCPSTSHLLDTTRTKQPLGLLLRRFHSDSVFGLKQDRSGQPIHKQRSERPVAAAPSLFRLHVSENALGPRPPAPSAASPIRATRQSVEPSTRFVHASASWSTCTLCSSRAVGGRAGGRAGGRVGTEDGRAHELKRSAEPAVL
jgi:hypothetical protein